MHTSTLLKSSDFQYWRLTDDRRISADFGTFCPDYHELDRVGVISPCFEDGILYTGDALLALTTAFYDVLRSQGTDFFDYPQHFAFIGTPEVLSTHTASEYRSIRLAPAGEIWMFGPIQNGLQHREALRGCSSRFSIFR